MLAAGQGRLEIVKLLVEGGANLYLESHWRDGSEPRNAFDYAADTAADTERHRADHARIETLKYLWMKSDGVRFASRLEQQIVMSCLHACDDRFGGDAANNVALFLISVTRDEAMLGRALSQAACRSQRPLEILAFLNKHAVRFPKNTLHCAAGDSQRSVEERIAMAAFFLDHGADIDDLSAAGWSPLMRAATAHDLEMVKFLLARGANPNTRSARGVTAIGLTANSCVHSRGTEVDPRQELQLAVVEYLARSGADAKLYASESARSQLGILTTCCDTPSHTQTQRRICQVFGL